MSNHLLFNLNNRCRGSYIVVARTPRRCALHKEARGEVNLN